MVLSELALRPERRPKPVSRRKRLRRGRGVERRQTAFICGASALGDRHPRRRGSCEVRHPVDRPRHPRRRVRAVERVHSKRLLTTMVEYRYHDVAAVRQGPAYLDLAVAPLEATVELEDSSRLRRAADRVLRTLAQLPIGHLGSLAARPNAGQEKLRHLRDPLDGRGGKRLRSCAVIFRIFSEPSLTWRCISSSFTRRFSAARSA